MNRTYYLPNVSHSTSADVCCLRCEGIPTWIITGIYVEPEYRGRGYGRQLLNMILADADAEGITLFLDVVGSGKMLNDQLADWYARNGFISTGIIGQLHDMKREPRKQSEHEQDQAIQISGKGRS